MRTDAITADDCRTAAAEQSGFRAANLSVSPSRRQIRCAFAVSSIDGSGFSDGGEQKGGLVLSRTGCRRSHFRW